jgi:signal peptidase
MSGLRAVARMAMGIVIGFCFLTLGFIGVGPRLLGYRTLTVLTGSMRPVMPPGSVAVVVREPADRMRVGQIVVYQAPIADRRVISHRIVSVTRDGNGYVLHTKGDANNGVDPWVPRIDDATVWHVRAVVPWLGSLIRLLRGRSIQRLLIYVVPALLAAIWLSEIWGRSANVKLRGRGAHA